MSYPAAVANDTVIIGIGGIPIMLRCGDAAFLQSLDRRYAGFISLKDVESGGADPVELTIEVLPAGTLQSDEDVRVWREGGVWRMERGDFRAQWNPHTGRGHLQQEANPYALNSVLRILHTLLLVPRGGFLVHAASAVRNRHAVVFAGVSGAGKTTISRLAPADATVLSDEISYIKPGQKGYCAWGTPFPGDLGVDGENLSAPIGSLFFLNKGSEHRLETIGPERALPMLMRNILFFSVEQRMVQLVFEAACEFVKQVPIRQLTFAPHPSVWEQLP